MKRCGGVGGLDLNGDDLVPGRFDDAIHLHPAFRAIEAEPEVQTKVLIQPDHLGDKIVFECITEFGCGGFHGHGERAPDGSDHAGVEEVELRVTRGLFPDRSTEWQKEEPQERVFEDLEVCPDSLQGDRRFARNVREVDYLSILCCNERKKSQETADLPNLRFDLDLF